MNRYIGAITRKIGSNKLIAAFILLTAVTVMSVSSVASAAPLYFAVEKPTSTSVCEGGDWHWEWRVTWHHWHIEIKRVHVWTPNWERLGFKSKAQCINYVTTPKPTSKADCDQQWRHLGFNNDGQCKLYLRLHPGGGGYGGNPQG